MQRHISFKRSSGLPADLRRTMIVERHKRGWSQAELGERVGLPQMHISGIETGKVMPRFDTLLDLVRVLGYDLLTVPRELVPVVQAMTRDRAEVDTDERPLYAVDEDEA